jgi:glycosyltransferase involved in cell wall biosynthesis
VSQQVVNPPGYGPSKPRSGCRAVGVAQIVRSLDTGGQEVLCARLVERLDPRRFRSLVISLQGGGRLADAIRDRGFKVLCLNAPEGWRPSTVARLAGTLRREKIRIAHCHNRKSLLYGGLAAGLVPGTRVVYTKHGVSHWTGGPVAVLGRALTRRAAAVAAVSADIASGLIAGRWALPGRLHLIPNGVDLQQFRPPRDRARCRALLGVPLSVPVVGTVARLSPEKDQATLLNAFARLLEVVPDARLLVVGGGPLRKELETLAAALGIAPYTRFTGERSDVAALLGAMDVFCLPSLTEGTSLTLLEAMATALPVVATAVGGTPEVVTDRRSGLLVEPGRPDRLAEALLEVLHHPDRADRMGAEGRAIVAERYSLEAMVDRYTELYERSLP